MSDKGNEYTNEGAGESERQRDDAERMSRRIFIQGPDSAGKTSCQFVAFDTVISITMYTPADGAQNDGAVHHTRSGQSDARQHESTHRAEEAHALCKRIQDWCADAEQKISRFIPTSDVSRINRADGKPVEVAQFTWDLIRTSLAYCKRSEGVFDITMGPVCALWDFKRKTIPSRADLDEALTHVGWEQIHLTKQGGRFYVQLDDPHASLDLGGIAKGYFADRLRDLMWTRGIRHGIVNLGGNVVVFGGKPDGSPFRVGIRNPSIPGKTHLMDDMSLSVPLTDGSVVTSGPYERYFERDGRVYHHILSTQDGMPVATDLASASIISQRSIDGDGYSTTLFALGCEKALEFVNATPEIEAILIRSDGTLALSKNISN